MWDSGLDGDRAQTSIADSDGEIDRDYAHDFGHGVDALRGRPLGTAFAGSVAFGPNHDPSLDDSRIQKCVDSSVESTLPSSLINGCSYNQREKVTADMARQIENFVPKIDPLCWAAIEAFVRLAVTDAEPQRRDTAYNWLQTSTRLVAWCWQSQGLELDRKVIYSALTIDRYVNQMRERPGWSKGTERSRLMDVSERLLGKQARSAAHKRHPRSEAPAPYPAAEIIALRSLANGLNTSYQRQTMRLLLAICMGSGATGSEVICLRGKHVEPRENGFVVHILGKRARTVPVSSAWENLLLEIWPSIRPENYLIASRRKTTTPSSNVLSQFGRKTASGGLRINSGRLRSTWLCAHLAAGTPLLVLMEAAGLTTSANFDRYLRYVETPPADERDDFLRLSGEQA